MNWIESINFNNNAIKNIQVNNTGSIILLCVNGSTRDELYLGTLNNNNTYTHEFINLSLQEGERILTIESATVISKGIKYLMYFYSTSVIINSTTQAPGFFRYIAFKLNEDDTYNNLYYIVYIMNNVYATTCSITNNGENTFMAVCFHGFKTTRIYSWINNSITTVADKNYNIDGLNLITSKFIKPITSLQSGIPPPLFYTSTISSTLFGFGVLVFNNNSGSYTQKQFESSGLYNPYYYSSIWLDKVNGIYYFYTNLYSVSNNIINPSNLVRMTFTNAFDFIATTNIANNAVQQLGQNFDITNYYLKTQISPYYIGSQLGNVDDNLISNTLFGTSEQTSSTISYLYTTPLLNSNNKLTVMDSVYSPTPTGTFIDYNYYRINNIYGSNYISLNDNLPVVMFATSPFVVGFYFYSFNGGGVCFIKDTLITILENNKEIQKEVQYLKPNDLVKVNENEYKKIVFIGENKYNVLTKLENIRIMKKDTIKPNYPCKDILLTSGHSVLFENLDNINEFYNPNIYKNNINGFYKMMTQHCKLFNFAELEDISNLIKNNFVQYYHFALENEDYDGQYAVYSNNIRSESMSINYIPFSGLYPINTEILYKIKNNNIKTEICL
jgi:hypothetical protein